MKKNLIAVGVAAALSSGGAFAQMNVNPEGIGHINILPYYSVQNGNATLISITNTDTMNGKAVKIRFRGVQNSDDVFDFQLFMSPGDMWTGAISQKNNVASMFTTDTSCTLPQGVIRNGAANPQNAINVDFVTARLLGSVEQQQAATREGYVEIINMGDIVDGEVVVDGETVPTNALYNTVKHNPETGDVACATSVLVGSGTTPVDLTDWLAPPTSGLTSYATVINVPASKAFTFPATAVSPEVGPEAPLFWRQANLDQAYSDAVSADDVFAPGQGNVRMYEFDLPDLSTPYQAGVTSAREQRDDLTAALAKAAVISEYVTDATLLAATDIVIAQPTKRYFYTWIDVPGIGTDSLRSQATITGAEAGSLYAGLTAITVGGVAGISNRITVGGATFTDRNEAAQTTSTGVVISPNPQPGLSPTRLEGEVSIIAVNETLEAGDATSSLGAVLTAQAYDSPYVDGWAQLSTTSMGQPGNGPLPVIGFTAINVYNGNVGAAGTNYGMTLPLKW